MKNREIKQSDVKWMDTENADLTRKTYHGYYGVKRKNIIYEDYNGNAALCNSRKGISEDGEGFVPIDRVDDNGLKRDRVCKSCLRIYDKLSNK